MHALDIGSLFFFRFFPERNSRIFQKLPLPVGDLVGMYFKQFGELRDRLVAFDRRQGDFGLEYWIMLSALFSCRLILLLSAVSGSQLGKITTYPPVQFSESSSPFGLVGRWE